MGQYPPFQNLKMGLDNKNTVMVGNFDILVVCTCKNLGTDLSGQGVGVEKAFVATLQVST